MKKLDEYKPWFLLRANINQKVEDQFKWVYVNNFTSRKSALLTQIGIKGSLKYLGIEADDTHIYSIVSIDEKDKTTSSHVSYFFKGQNGDIPEFISDYMKSQKSK